MKLQNEQKLNSNEVLKSFYQIRKQENEELKSLVDTYNINEVSPLQVAGDDTIPGFYSTERDALYNIRTTYNAG